LELTTNESYVLQTLHKRVEIIIGKKHIDSNINLTLSNSILKVTNCDSFPVIFGNYSPDEIAFIIISLVQKEMLKEYNLDGCISFVPSIYNLTTECNVKK
jgi:hypothetical protein